MNVVAYETMRQLAGWQAPGVVVAQRQRLKGESVVIQAAVSLAMSALLFQPIAEQGMYSMDASGKLSKGSFNSLEVPAMGERETVPTIEAFFPFSK